MNRCLSERALLRVCMREGTAAEHSHLRRCADCAERQDQFAEDLETIERALAVAPLHVAKVRRLAWRPAAWMSAAVACAALGVLVLGVAWLRPSPPVQVEQASAVSTFAADLSAALFPMNDTGATLQLAAEAPYLEAALEMGQPCTQERFFAGECDDQLSPGLIETD